RRRDLLVRLAVVHVMHEPNALAAELSKLGPHVEQRSREDFALVLGLLIRGNGRPAGALEKTWRQPELGQEVPGRLVKAPSVRGYVHVPDLVDRPGIDETSVGLQRSIHA